MNKNALLEFPIGDPFPIDGDLRRYDPITAILGGTAISAGASLLGGIFGSNAASNAAKTEEQAATTAGQDVTNAATSVNPGILAAGQAAGAGATAAAGTAADNANTAAAAAAEGATNTASAAAAGANTAATSANNLLDPYVQTGNTAEGVLNAGVQQGGEFNSTPTLSQLQMDPSYQFVEQQDQQALARSAAANGGVDSGGYSKDLLNYEQGEASKEYQQAFNDYQTSTQNKFNNVNSVANAGQAAANTSGQNLIGAAQYGGNIEEGASQYSGTTQTNASEFGGNLNTSAAEFAGTANENATDLAANNTTTAAGEAANYLTQGANAAAAGKVASTNALTGGLTGAATAVGQGGMLASIFTNPASNYFSTPYGRSAGPMSGSYNPFVPYGASYVAGNTPTASPAPFQPSS